MSDPPFGPTCGGPGFSYHRCEGVLQVRGRATRWLSSGYNGGSTTASAAYNVTVPEGFDRTDLDAYARERRENAGFAESGPTLFTGVSQSHARGATAGPVETVATVGLSNPAALPIPDRPAADAAAGSDVNEGSDDPTRAGAEHPQDSPTRADDPHPPDGPTQADGPHPPDGPTGTVNVVLGTGHALEEGTLASLLGTVVEAKTATLLQETGFTGTTSDAVVVGCNPAGPEAEFAGAGTALGAAARASVRAAVRASLRSRYGDSSLPGSVAAARHGSVTDRRADVFRPQ